MTVLDRFNEVVRRAQAGEAQAQEELLAVLRPYLERLARGLASSPRASRSSSDLVQEGLLRVWQRLEQFGGADDDARSWAMFRAWVGQIVRRLNLNEQRDRKAQRRRPQRPIASLQAAPPGEGSGPRPGIDLPSPDPTPKSRACLNEQELMVKAAMKRLGDDTSCAVVRMHFFEGLSLRQVSERLQISYDQVRRLYRDGIRRLERELGPLQ